MEGRRALQLCALAAILLSAPMGVAAKNQKPAGLPPVPSKTPAEYLVELRRRFANVDSADVSRACGNLTAPWAYRGPSGKQMAMRSAGRTHAGSEWAGATARLLVESARVDSTGLRRDSKAACDWETGRPVYLSNFYTHAGQTLALVAFDNDFVEFFDANGSLGSFRLGAAADSLWAAVGTVLASDPVLRAPRPQVTPTDTLPQMVYVEELPSVLERSTPEYPADAVAQGVSGVVMIQALIGADGKVHDAYVLTGPWPLRDAALEAVWQWVFMPAMSNKKPTPVWVAVPVSFKLK
jgi:protein TonB